ncbi:Transposon Ty3-G Gag-Pol poly [Brachionus plicatilis]|uniref:Transposon Ty3-G Gag-Pol poly n=1 Tax=Brachionus plicatilis TaxID=10195 RepID=A0A3M7PC24_BRAPC|nr:Transposon Ty3-G Gag-Pol poly [Brachionus plicatilis]
MTDTATCGNFQYQTGEDLATAGSRWGLWLERFKLYVLAKDLSPERIKANFLLMIGPEVHEIYKGLRRKEDNETPAEAYKLLSDHFTAQRSEFAEEQKFRHTKRRQGEPIHDFVMRLRQQAVHCSFGETLERNLLSQFVAGSNMSAFQEKCCQTKELKLAKAIEIAQAYESTAHNMSMLINPTAEEHTSILYTAQQSQKQPSSDRQASKQPTRNGHMRNKQCGYCGRSCKSKETCPAKGQKCLNCGKLGHYASMCRSTKSQKGSYDRSNRSQVPKSFIRHIDTTEACESTNTSSHTLDKVEYAKYIRFKQAEQYGLFAVKASSTRINDGPRVNVHVNNTEMLFLIDTGAPTNVIDEETYRTMNPTPTLEKCNTTFYGYKANEPLPILGHFVAQISHSNKRMKAGFIVIKGQAELLLGHKTAIELGIIQVCRRLTANDFKGDQSQQQEKYKALFPQLFSDRIGCIKGAEVRLDIDPNIRPVKQKLRPVAIHLQDAVSKELQKQVDEDILERVNSTMGPTTWISNLVVIPKGNPSEQVTGETQLKELHEYARRNDEEAKKRMKKDFDLRMKAREPQIKVGARVLLKVERKVKSDPTWDPTPYTVITVKGTMITAKRDNRQVTRNVSLFKPFYDFGEKIDNDPKIIITGQSPSHTQPVPLSQTMHDLAPPELDQQLPQPEPETQQQLQLNHAQTTNKVGRPRKEDRNSIQANLKGDVTEPRRSERLKAKNQDRQEDVVSQPQMQN